MDHKNKNFGYPPGKRMTSSVWKYFAFELAKDGKVIDSTKVHCLKCYEIISYHSATTSMDRHLITAHRISSNSEETSASPAKVQKQLEFTVQEYDATNPRVATITNAITKMIAKYTLPFSFVEEEGFLELIRVLDPKFVC